MTAIPAIPRSSDWHAIRRAGIGSSEAPLLAGVNPPSRGDPVTLLQQLYAEKVGTLDPEDRPDNPLMEWGRRLEEPIARWYEDRTGLRTRVDNKVRTHRSFPWMRASLDRVVVPGPRLLEIKTVPHGGEAWGEDGTAEVPLHVLVQVQHQLAVTGYPVADVAALLRGHDARLYTIPRDEGLIMDLVELEGTFWAAVERREEPDWSAFLPPEKRPRPPADGELILSREDELNELVRQAWVANLVRAEAEEVERAVKDQLTAAIDAWSYVRAEAVDVSYRASAPSRRTAWDLVAAAYRKQIEELDAAMPGAGSTLRPDLDAIESLFTVEEAGRRPLRFVKHKD